MPSIRLKGKGLVGVVFGILIVAWFLAIMTAFTAHGLIHVLLGLALGVSLFRIRRRRPQEETFDDQSGEPQHAAWLTANPDYEMHTPRANRLRKVA
jgi:hypothetical protein